MTVDPKRGPVARCQAMRARARVAEQQAARLERALDDAGRGAGLGVGHGTIARDREALAVPNGTPRDENHPEDAGSDRAAVPNGTPNADEEAVKRLTAEPTEPASAHESAPDTVKSVTPEFGERRYGELLGPAEHGGDRRSESTSSVEVERDYKGEHRARPRFTHLTDPSPTERECHERSNQSASRPGRPGRAGRTIAPKTRPCP